MKKFLLILLAFSPYLYGGWKIQTERRDAIVIEFRLKDHNFYKQKDEYGPHGQLLMIPNQGKLHWSIGELQIEEVKDVKLPDLADTSTSPVKVGVPGIMRDLRVVEVIANPIFEKDGQIYLLKHAVVNLEFRGVGKNELINRPSYSQDFLQLYKSLVMNFKEEAIGHMATLTKSQYGAKLIIVTPDEFYNAILPLAEWKTQKGVLTYVAKLSEIGSSPSEIKSFLQYAYNNWNPAPEYVLLVGDANHIPFASGTDNYYGTLAGDDIFNDVFVGRFPASSASEASTMATKSLSYEKNPYMSDSLWFRRGIGIVREDGDAADTLYWGDILHLAGLMGINGCVSFDTLSRDSGDNYLDILNGINEGRALVAYRGQGVGNWWSPFNIDPNQTQNGWKLPLIVSTTCATINIDNPDYPYAGELWLKVGSALNPKGAVGFFGTTTVRSHVAHIRSAVFRGFVDYIFSHQYTNGGLPITFGAASEAGRLHLWETYQDVSDYKGFTTLGDPELNIWTYTPAPLNVDYPTVISPGINEFTISVVDGNDSSPVAEALICLSLDTLLYLTGYTDNNGQCTFEANIPESAVGDSITLTVTGKNFLPYQTSIFVSEVGPYITYTKFIYSDALGNGDGNLNPGEEILLGFTYKNFGSDSAHTVKALLTSQNSLVDILDSIDIIGDLGPGDSSEKDNEFSFVLSPHFENNDTVILQLKLLDSEGDTWQRDVRISEIVGVDFNTISANFLDDQYGDGDGYPEPGESLQVWVDVFNEGEMGATNVNFHISPKKLWAPLEFPENSVNISQVGPGDTAEVGPFLVIVKRTAKEGVEIPLKLTYTGDAETYTYMDSSNFNILIGDPKKAPIGPVLNYFAYDNSDVSSGRAPTYEWIEIAPPGPGEIIPEITDEDADTVTIPLPFTFRFFGVEFDSVGVCSNGFLELGSSTFRLGTNTFIPFSGGPKNLVAPFWDDLDPSSGGDIYQYFDADNHLFIIEFNECVHYNGASPETFEVIFLDPNYHPTPTGDGGILFQYKTVSDASSCTVGIEDPTESFGIQYLYNGAYNDRAQPLESGRAILFTTLPPKNNLPTRVKLVGITLRDLSGKRVKAIERGHLNKMTLKVDVNDDAHFNRGDIWGFLPIGTIVEPDSFIFVRVDEKGERPLKSPPISIKVDSEYNDTLILLPLVLFLNGTLIGETEIPIKVASPLQVKGGKRIKKFYFKRVGPNPVSGIVRWVLSLPVEDYVKLDIYNASGRCVANLVDSRLKGGVYRFKWVTNDMVPNGVYFGVLQTSKRKKTERFLLIR